MKSKKVLVTGGAGFIGSWLVDELIERGHKVVTVDDLSGGYESNVNKKSKFIKADLRDRQKVDTIFSEEKFDIVFHLAAYAAEGQSIFSPIEINDINLTPMNNLLVAAVNNNVQKFVFTSSMAVYGSQQPPFSEEMLPMPEDPYGCGKAYCENMLKIFAHTYDFDFVIIRPHNVYGPRQNIADPFRNVLGIWINRIMKNKEPYIFGDGKQERAFSYIGDVAPAIANAGLESKANGETINVGSDEVTSINDACQVVLKAMNSKLKPIYQDARPGEVKYAYCTSEKSQKLLNYKTTTNLKKGIEIMVKWAKEVGPQEPTYRLPLEITKKAPQVWREKLV
ncbi:MAG: NAD-dependent epimerase/dehydratase family protein [Candidatus Bathyarchaeota archaeon]|nr:NAD-dependent epimerase/dehydratase family protein [Candidatus Bathyarchaeota archaeon]